jgi:hypothetical protein
MVIVSSFLTLDGKERFDQALSDERSTLRQGLCDEDGVPIYIIGHRGIRDARIAAAQEDGRKGEGTT